MFPTPDNDADRQDEILARVEALAAWIQEVDTRLRAAELTSTDQKTAKELRKAVEALAKHDPKLEERLTHRVDVLKDRIATLADTVGATSATLAAKDGELISLRRALEAEHARLEKLVAGKAGGRAPAELEELRKTVADLAAEQPKRRGRRDGKEDAALDGKLEVLQQRLDMLAETVSTTAAGLASRDGDLAAVRRRLDEDGRKVDAALDELRSAGVPLAELKLTVKEMSQEAATAARQSRRGVDGVTARVDAVAEKVDALGEAASGAAEELASGRQELAALRGAFDSETGRLDAHVAKIEQYLASISPRMKALESLPSRQAIEALDVQVQGASAAIDSFAGTLAALSQAVAETGQGYAERELELAALSRRFDEARSEVESLVTDVRAEVQALSEAGADARQEASAERAELAQGLEQVTHRIDAVERERASSQSELEGALAASAEERETLAAGSRLLEERVSGLGKALEALSGQVEASGQGQAERDEQLLALSRRFEEGRERVDALVSDLRAAIETMPTPDPARLDGIEEQVGELTRRLGELADVRAETREQASAARAELAQALEQVTHRIDAVERERASSQSELEGALAASAEERETLAAGARLLEEKVHGITEALEALSGRIDDGRDGVDAVLAEARSELASLRDAGAGPEVEARLAAFSERVETLDRRLVELAATQETASSARAELDEELSVLRGSFDEETGRLDAHVARIEQALAVLEPRLVGLADLPSPDLLAGLEGRVEQASTARAELAQALEQLTHRIDAVERERASSQSELEGALAASADERETLAAGARLLEEKVHVVTEALEALSGRIEDGRGEVGMLASELRAEIESMRAPDPALSARLELLAQTVQAQAATMSDATAGIESGHRELASYRSLLDVLNGRQDDVAERIDAIAAAVESRAASKETDVVLGKVLLRLDALERAQQSLTAELSEAATSTGASEDVVAELRLLLENARARIELLELAAKPSGTHVEPEHAQVVSIRGSEG